MKNSILIIAEVSQTHDGSLGQAHAFIDAVARTGADGIKFQTHIAAAESTPSEPWRVKFSYQDSTRYDYWRRMEFTQEQWLGLNAHAVEQNLLFLSSPFSMEAAEMLSKIGVAAWKVGSGEVTNKPLLQLMADTALPIWISTGMSSLSELDEIVSYIKTLGNELTLLQCTSMYPTPPEKVGLNLIPLYKNRYGCKVGLSDHSGTIYPGIASAMLGVDLIEVHVTLSREMFGPDVSSSITTSELKDLVAGVRFIETVQNNPVTKNTIAEELSTTRSIFAKSLVASHDLKAGSVLARNDVTLKKAGAGLRFDKLETIIGRRLKNDVLENRPVTEEDFA